MRWSTIGICGLTAAVLAFGIARWIDSTRSPTERVRAVIVDAAESFNAGRLRCLAGFHPEFRDLTSSRTRRDLHAGIAYALHGPAMKGRKFRLELEDPALSVGFEAADPAVATSQFRLLLYEAAGPDPERLIWELDVQATLIDDPDQGWRLLRSEHRSVFGAPPKR